MTMLATRVIFTRLKWQQLHLKIQFKCNRILAEKYQIDFSILFIKSVFFDLDKRWFFF